MVPIQQAVEELLGRASGPMHLRLILQPTMATILAVRAGLRDARTGRPAFFWEVVTHPALRRQLIASAWKDIGKVFLLAITLDVIYQLIEFHAFHPVQTLIVAVVLAIVPYVLVRGPVTRVARVRRPSTA